MSFSKIKQLRKEGRLKEAFELAQNELTANPTDIWAKRAIAWVYYDLLKNAANRNLLEQIIDILKRIKQTDLPAGENIFFESVAWGIGKYLNKTKNIEPAFFGKLTEALKQLAIFKPAASFTFLVKSFLKKCEDSKVAREFMQWSGFENFRKEDYEKRELENGQKILSDVEQIYVAASKIFLKEPVDKQTIEDFLPLIAKLCADYPQMQYPHYYHAKLLLATGDKERFLKAFITFARRKKRDFWVWDLMSEVFEKSDRRYFACLCRSLSCGAPVKFSLNVKEKFAEVLLNKSMKAEAKYEIEEVVKCRTFEHWHFTPNLQKWLADEQLKNISPVKSNETLYRKYAPQADKLLFYDLKPEIIVVENVNREKKVVRFVASKEKYGTFLYYDFDINPSAGDVYNVRFIGEGSKKNPGFYKAATMEISDETPPEEIYKTVSGRLKKREVNSFGFVGQVFIPPELISINNLKNNDSVKTNALLTFNKKKKEWGWKGVEIFKTDY